MERGVHTNVWPLLESSPADVTLHVMTPGVDTGAILTQSDVPVAPWGTALTLCAKLEEAVFRMLVDVWPPRMRLALPGRGQPPGESEHVISHLGQTDTFDLDAHPGALGLFNHLRARTFALHSGLKLRAGGTCVTATIRLCGPDAD